MRCRVARACPSDLLVQFQVAEKDLDAVVLTSYHSIKYYSDFLYTTFGRNYALVVTAEDSVTVTANIDAGMPWRTSCVTRANAPWPCSRPAGRCWATHWSCARWPRPGRRGRPAAVPRPTTT